MSSAKKCDRCGKLFEAYIKRQGDKKASAYIVSCYVENKGKADKCDFCIAREKCEELRSVEGTMCERCAKQGTSKCHCDCAREFEPKEEKSDEM